MKIEKKEVLAGNKMANAAILAKQSTGYNSAIYEPIAMKFEIQVLIGMPSIKVAKPEVLTGNKMAEAAILAKPSKGFDSAIYEPILMKFETRVFISIYCMKTPIPKCWPEAIWPPIEVAILKAGMGLTVQKQQILIDKNGKALLNKLLWAIEALKRQNHDW